MADILLHTYCRASATAHGFKQVITAGLRRLLLHHHGPPQSLLLHASLQLSTRPELHYMLARIDISASFHTKMPRGTSLPARPSHAARRLLPFHHAVVPGLGSPYRRAMAMHILFRYAIYAGHFSHFHCSFLSPGRRYTPRAFTIASFTRHHASPRISLKNTRRSPCLILRHTACARRAARQRAACAQAAAFDGCHFAPTPLHIHMPPFLNFQGIHMPDFFCF